MKSLKGYDHKNHRWQWMINRKRCGVTLEELGLPKSQWTQEGSRPAAWQRYCQFVAQLKQEAEHAHPFADQIQVLTHRFQVAQDLGINADDVKADIDEFKALTEKDEAPPLDQATADRVKAFEMMTGHSISHLDPVSLEAFFGQSDLWGERKAQTGRVDTAKTILANAKEYLSGKQEDVLKHDTRSPDGVDNIRRWLWKYVEYMGELSAVDSIDFKNWESWQKTCQAKCKRMNTEEGKKDYQTSKAFVKWCWKQNRCELPKNFDDQVTFEFDTPEPNPYPIADVKKTLKLATGKLRCFLLLMLNCGMTAKDISDLTKTQIDLDAGTISRKRSKTKSKKGVPLVTYKLWQETLKAIQECLSNHESIAFLTKSGQKFCRKWLVPETGKFRKCDNIATLFNNLKKANPKVDYLRDLRSFKKTSSTLLRNNPTFSMCFRLFLGHSERGIAEKHYAGITQENFNDACAWLAKQFGVNA